MCDSTQTPDHRERLAEKIRARTNDGDDILHYLFGVFYDQDDPNILHGHRLQATRMLVKHGHLSPFALEMVKEMPSDTGRKADREEARSDSKLAERIRRVTNDGDDIVDYLLDTMNGKDSSSRKRVPHNARLAATRELLKRGYDYECVHDAAASVPAPVASDAPAPQDEDRIEQSSDNSEEGAEYIPSPEEEARMQVAIEKIKRIIEEEASSKREEEPSGRRIDYSMWEIIRNQPQPVITKEHARIGAALFREAVAKQRLWRESNVKIPTRNDHNNYDDG